MNWDGSIVTTKFNWLSMGSGADISVPDGSRSIAIHVGEYREREKRQLLLTQNYT
jgi:hypothetical protein